MGGVLHNFIYFHIGSLTCKYIPEVINDRKILALSTMIFAALIMLYLFGFTNELISLLLAFSGILFCCFFVSVLPRNYLNSISKFSFQIYLLSWFPQTAVRIIFGQVLFLNIWLSVLLSFALGVTIPFIAVTVIARFRITYLNAAVGM